MDHVFGERLARMMIVLVTYRTARLSPCGSRAPRTGTCGTELLVAWNEAGDMVAERDNVIAATYDGSLA